MRIKGITVKLHNKVQTGTDPLGAPIYTEEAVDIPNVLILPVSSDESTEDVNLYGITTIYQLFIPKGDDNDWTHKKVSFYGSDWQTIGEVTQYIEDNVPLSWNKKVKVAHYE